MAVAEKRTVSINPTRMRLAEYDRQDWVCNAELGTTVEDILKVEFWTHMAALMKPYDHIEVRIDDGSWVAFLIVTACDRNWAKVQLLSKHQLVADVTQPVSSIKHRVDHKGPQLKWCVIRVADGERVQSEMASKEAASEWLRNYERVI